MHDAHSAILTLHDNAFHSVVSTCANVLAGGGVVVIPTDTVYGLAVDPRVPGAGRRLRSAKQRDEKKPFAYLAATQSSVIAFGALMNAREQRLADAFWPGPLTLVLKMDVPTADEAPHEEGFRAPDHAFVQALLLLMQTPLLVTSANVSGSAPALTVDDARRQLGDHVDLYVDAGPITGGAVSSVVRASGDSLEILREAAITAERLREVAGP